jgi:hypothetical protein
MMMMSPASAQPPAQQQDLHLILPQRSGNAANTVGGEVILPSVGDANMRGGGGGGGGGGGASEAAAAVLMWQQHASLLATQLEMARQQLAVTQQQLAQAQAATPATGDKSAVASGGALAVVPVTADTGELSRSDIVLQPYAHTFPIMGA